ncbi:MAG: hypothetical protein EOM15_02865 [Spirochaetia bacterium]|nr:hypothetical protein [Spirochaetia bacterium]
MAIEDEKISCDLVYASICERLHIRLETKAKRDYYAQSISLIVLDATENFEPLTSERIVAWHSLLFSCMAGRTPKHICSYRQGSMYITNIRGMDFEIVYE